MLFHKRMAVWLVAATNLAAAVSGCSLAPKSDPMSIKKAAVKQQQATNPGSGSATPGSADFSSSKELKNPIKVHLAYALWHEQQGNLLEARNSYNRVLEKNSKNIDALLGLARLDTQLNRLSDAESRLQKAQKVAPKNPQVVAAVGQFYAAQRDWPRALEQLKTARALSPYEPTYPYQLGIVQARSGDLAAALTSLTEAVGAAEAHFNLAVILQEQEKSAEAEDHLKQALALKSDLTQAQVMLNAMYHQRQENKGTVEQTAATSGAFGEKRQSVQHANHVQSADR